MKPFSFAICLLLTATLCYSQTDSTFSQAKKQTDWIFVTVTMPDLDAVYIKSDFVSKDGNYLKVWVKYDHKEKKIKGKVYKNAKSLVLFNINCGTKEIQLLQSITYNSVGKQLESNNYGEDDSWTVVAPESTGESILSKACNIFK